MKHRDVVVFKVYSDWSIKKLFKMSMPDGLRYPDIYNKIRNRLIHQRRNVGIIYVVQQLRYGLSFEKFPNGIPLNGHDGPKNPTQNLHYEELEYIIKVTNRHKPLKASWFKIRK